MQPRIIELPKKIDERGNLSFFESQNHIPFQIKRCYWIYDVPGGEYRGGHAFKNQMEFIVALSGSFEVVVDDGVNQTRFTMNRSYYGIFIPNLVWRSLENFSTNSLALVVCSSEFSEEDYIRDFEIYKKLRNETAISI